MVLLRPSLELLEQRDVPSTFHPDAPHLHAEHAALLALVHAENVSYEYVADNDMDINGDGLVAYSELGGSQPGEPVNPNEYYLNAWLEAYPQLATFLAQNPFFTPIFVSFGPQTFGPVPQPEPIPGDPPQDGDDIFVPAGVKFLLDQDTARIGTFTVAEGGSFAINPVADLDMFVDTLAVLPGGSANITSTTGSLTLTFTDSGLLDISKDPTLLGRGFLSHGSTIIDGRDKLAWTGIQNVRAGSDTLILTDVPEGWEIGDRILIVGTAGGQDEVFHIAALAGNTVLLDGDLRFDHVAPEGFTAHAGNLTRNITFRSEATDSTRFGHAMFMHSPAVSVDNAAFANMGRTNKLLLLDDTPTSPTDNQRGRYGLHLHELGAAIPVNIRGVVVEGGPGWGMVNHSSNAKVTGSIAFNVVAGFVAEAGNEQGEFTGNLAVPGSARGDPLPFYERRFAADFGFGATGFWGNGGPVKFVDNVAAGGISGYGFWAERILRPEPGVFRVAGVPQTLGEFRGNTAYAVNTGVAVTATSGGVLEDTQVWGASRWGVSLTSRALGVDVVGGRLLGSGSWSAAVFHETDGSSGDILGVDVTGWGLGYSGPATGDMRVEGGAWDNNSYDLYLNLNGNLTVRGLDDPSFYIHPNSFIRPVLNLLEPKRILVEEPDGETYQVYGLAQGADVVFPWSSKNFAPVEFVGLTNAQIQERYGTGVNGQAAPADATMGGSTWLKGTVQDSPPVLKSASQVAGSNYTLLYEYQGQTYTEARTLGVVGWNLLEVVLGEKKYTLVVYRMW